uniref:Uncharacterized protein n=1 Tax=Salix viminalis TaxID=40686 RepID=A0A6N2KFC2_SALVM
MGLLAASWSLAWIMVKDSLSLCSWPSNPQANLIPSAAMEITLFKVSSMVNANSPTIIFLLSFPSSQHNLFIARRRARLRKEVLLAGEGWPYDPERKEMGTKMKGHKCDRIAAERRAKTAKLMEQMPEIAACKERRRRKR